MQKMILADAAKCTGCRTCELVCAVKNEGIANPARARVHIVRFEEIVFEVPMFCQQCEIAPCISVCPVKAIKRDEVLGLGKIDHDRCIGCKMCMAVCPFGAIGFNPVSRRVFKCDHCGEDVAIRRVSAKDDDIKTFTSRLKKIKNVDDFLDL